MAEEKFIPWNEISPTDRGLQEYLEHLGLKKEELIGKTILDIGSGLNQLAEDIKKENLDIKIVPFDLFYSISKDEREKIYEKRYNKEGFQKAKKKLSALEAGGGEGALIAGLGEELPFKNESFDMVFSLYAMPHYAESDAQIDKFFKEAVRVVKKGGTVRIHPSWYRIRGKLKQYGFDDARVKKLEEEEGIVVVSRTPIILLKPEDKE